MSSLGYVAKRILIANQVRENILSGCIKEGEQLKPDTELALEYDVNKRTVSSGMAQLVSEGLISRTPGRGSIVLRREKVVRTSKAVGLFMFNDGDVYGTMVAEITSGLLKRGLYPVRISQDIFRTATLEPDFAPMTKLMEQLLDDSPFGLIVDGDRFIPMAPLRRNLPRIKSLVFVLRYQQARKMSGAKYVLVDYEKGGALMARHLIEKGHRRLAFCPHPQPFGKDYGKSPQDQMLDGFRKTCLRNGVEQVDSISERLIMGEPPERVMTEALSSDQRPTALGFPSDFFWCQTIKPVTETLGLRLPADLSVVGFYNTSWTERVSPRLSSFSINEEKLARIALTMLSNETDASEILVVPELVRRESVAAI